MTTLYVSSVDGNNADDGSTWALAKATVQGAISILTGTGPHTIYVDSAHATTAATTWNVPVTNQQVAVISVNRNGSSGTGHNGWLAGATETGTTAFVIQAGFIYVWGMTLQTVVGGTSGNDLSIGTANNAFIWINNCIIKSRSSGSGARIRFGAAQGGSTTGNTVVIVENSDLHCNDNAGSSSIQIACGHIWLINVKHYYIGSNKPLSFIDCLNTGGNALITVMDSDISGYNTTNGFYLNVTNVNGPFIRFINCKLSSTPGFQTGSFPANSLETLVLNTSSSNTNNVFEHRHRLGTLTSDTSIYRTSGAVYDNANTSWKIVTSSNASENTPYFTPWIHRWTTSTGSLDFSLQLLRQSATDYTNRDVWMQVETLEDSSFSTGTFSSSRNVTPFDGTGVDLTNSTDNAWNVNAATDNEMIVTLTRTVQKKTLVRARLCVALASTTLYLDPMLYISGQPSNCPTRWTVEGAVNAEPVAPKANYIAGL